MCDECDQYNDRAKEITRRIHPDLEDGSYSVIAGEVETYIQEWGECLVIIQTRKETFSNPTGMLPTKTVDSMTVIPKAQLLDFASAVSLATIKAFDELEGQ